jgi:REP-associated tyrosine transposase
MVIGSHVIFTADGFWLPNDPRGSWSNFVGSWELFRFGPVTKMEEGERRSSAHLPHDWKKRVAAKQALKQTGVSFRDKQIRVIARAFADYVSRTKLSVWACSIMPEHVHLVIERHRLDVEQIVIGLKGNASAHLLAAGIHPFQSQWDQQKPPPKCWSRGE